MSEKVIKKLNIIVHDLYPEIGHCRAMLEVLRCYKKEQFTHINFICFQHDKKENLLPDYDGEVVFHKVPFSNIKPFILKSLFFQIYTYIMRRRLCLDQSKTITIGVCSFIGDIVNVQFVHHMWTHLYFEMNRPGLFKKIYKKILLNYLEFCECIYYKIKKPQLVCLSKFIADELQEKYHYNNDMITTAYSSAANDEFYSLPSSREEIFQDLCMRNERLKELDIQKPILLFVGAFERKGLQLILDNKKEDQQLVIIGKPEVGSHINLDKYQNTIHIDFTKEINLFFNLCDCFVFPTSYEPFGLVVIEAAASGMNIIVTKKRVGASELLENIKGVFFSSDHTIKDLMANQKILTREQREINVENRHDLFKKHSWENAAHTWLKSIAYLSADK